MSVRGRLAYRVMLGWWLVVLAVAIIGNTILLIKMIASGNMTGVVAFTFFLGGALTCVWRTYTSRDQIRADLRD